MLRLQDAIKYVGLAAIIFFLTKAFIGDKLSNQEIALFVFIVILIIWFLTMQNNYNSNPNLNTLALREKYQITDPPVVDSIYPGPDNTERRIDKLNPRPKSMPDADIDKDVRDFKDIAGIDKKTYEALIKNEQKAEDRIRDNYRDEMVYTSTHPFNTVPLGTQLYGYTYLPPENWFRAYERPPVCVTDKKCPVCPIAEGGSSSGLMEFDTSNNITGPAGINLRYIKKVMNKDQ